MVFVLAGSIRISAISHNVQMQCILRHQEPLLVNMNRVIKVIVMEVNGIKFRARIHEMTKLMNFGLAKQAWVRTFTLSFYFFILNTVVDDIPWAAARSLKVRFLYSNISFTAFFTSSRFRFFFERTTFLRQGLKCTDIWILKISERASTNFTHCCFMHMKRICNRRHDTAPKVPFNCWIFELPKKWWYNRSCLFWG